MREAGKTGVVHKLQALGRSRLEGAGCEAGCAKKINAGLMGATSGFHQLSMSCRVKQPPVNMGTTENMKIEGFGGGFFALKTSRVCPPIVPPQRAKALWWKDHPPGL